MGGFQRNVCVVPPGKFYLLPKLQESIIQFGGASILRRHSRAVPEDDLIRNLFKAGAANTYGSEKSPSTLKHLTTEGGVEVTTVVVVAHSHFTLMSEGLSPSRLYL